MASSEVRIELLLGRRVRDAAGKALGRIEEIHAEADGNDLVIKEYIVGSYGLLERLAALPLRALPLLKPKRLRHLYKVPWDKMDLSNPEKPRVTCAASEVQQTR